MASLYDNGSGSNIFHKGYSSTSETIYHGNGIPYSEPKSYGSYSPYSSNQDYINKKYTYELDGITYYYYIISEGRSFSNSVERYSALHIYAAYTTDVSADITNPNHIDKFSLTNDELVYDIWAQDSGFSDFYYFGFLYNDGYNYSTASSARSGAGAKVTRKRGIMYVDSTSSVYSFSNDEAYYCNLCKVLIKRAINEEKIIKPILKNTFGSNIFKHYMRSTDIGKNVGSLYEADQNKTTAVTLFNKSTNARVIPNTKYNSYEITYQASLANNYVLALYGCPIYVGSEEQINLSANSQQNVHSIYIEIPSLESITEDVIRSKYNNYLNGLEELITSGQYTNNKGETYYYASKLKKPNLLIYNRGNVVNYVCYYIIIIWFTLTKQLISH